MAAGSDDAQGAIGSQTWHVDMDGATVRADRCGNRNSKRLLLTVDKDPITTKRHLRPLAETCSLDDHFCARMKLLWRLPTSRSEVVLDLDANLNRPCG